MKEKVFKIASEDIKQIIESNIGCIASNMITVKGYPVGYMYREEPEEAYDSGWRFFCGQENQEYVDTTENFSCYKINTIANYDPSILPYLDFPFGSSLDRIEGTNAFELIPPTGTPGK
jgi:hypothetical protein